MLTMSTFSPLHEKNNFASQFLYPMNVSLDQLHVYLLCTHIRSKRTKVRARSWKFHISFSIFYRRSSTHDAYNFHSVNFLNHRFHAIGKHVQNYRYRLSTDMANIGPIPIPIIGQSLIQSANFEARIFII